MTTDHDPRTRIVLSWLREDAHENAERVLLRTLNEVDTTPQRRSWWPAWRTSRKTAYAGMVAAAAVVLVVAIGGYQLLPRGFASGGATGSPSPSPVLLARGIFAIQDRAVDLEAFAQGSTVTGHMHVSWESEADEDGSFTVDLQCTRATEEGLILIGGRITDSTTWISSAGTWAAIVLKPGSPVEARIWTEKGGQHPIGFGPSCEASLDAGLEYERSGLGFGLELDAIEGTLELGSR